MIRLWKNFLLKRAREAKNINEQLRIVRNRDYEIRMELIKNPNINFLVLEKLIQDDSENVRAKIAKYLVDSDIIDEMIISEEDENVLLRLAKNKNLSEIQQIALLHKKYVENVWCYFAYETTSYNIMKICLGSENEVVNICLARNRELEKSIAMELAKSPYEDVRFYLACETSYEEVLDYLADDEKIEENLIEVAKNPATNNRTLYKLSSKHQSELVREAVASNDNLSDRIRKRLLSDPSPRVRERCMHKPEFWY